MIPLGTLLVLCRAAAGVDPNDVPAALSDEIRSLSRQVRRLPRPQRPEPDHEPDEPWARR